MLVEITGTMENPDANQLPEVDSLPDGFVDSPTEPLAPATPTLEQEKPLGSNKECNISPVEGSNESIQESSANESEMANTNVILQFFSSLFTFFFWFVWF